MLHIRNASGLAIVERSASVYIRPVEQYELSLPMTVWFTFSRPTHDLNGRKLRAPRCALFWRRNTETTMRVLCRVSYAVRRVCTFLRLSRYLARRQPFVWSYGFLYAAQWRFPLKLVRVCARRRYGPENVFSINVFRSPAVFGSVRSSKRRPITVLRHAEDGRWISCPTAISSLPYVRAGKRDEMRPEIVYPLIFPTVVPKGNGLENSPVLFSKTIVVQSKRRRVSGTG